MKYFFKLFILYFVFCISLGVFAEVKCDDGKPGDTVNCVVTNGNANGTIKRILVDEGLTFVSCDVCDETGYTLSPTVSANFKFKIDDKISENKTLTATFGGETAKINVVVENENDDNDEDGEETTYTVTLIPGKNEANKTKTCTVNSLNDTCSVTLDKIDDADFTGWAKEKDCTEGEVEGSIKVNKDMTYYACYKSATLDNEENEEENVETSADLLLKTLVVKNGDEVIDLGFSIRIFEYNITVPTDVNSLIVEAEGDNEDVQINITGQDKLENDTNKIVVKLSLNDETKEYVINVLKKDDVKVPMLNNLVIAGYLNDFSPEKFTYIIKLDKGIKNLTIEHEEDDAYEVAIVGNENLKDGSQIKILVSDKVNDGLSTYVINVEQDNSSIYIWLAGGVGILIILIILLIIVVNKGKKQKKKSKVDVNKKNASKNVVSRTNNSVSIPEVSPVMPQAPINQKSSEDSQKESIETLDL